MSIIKQKCKNAIRRTLALARKVDCFRQLLDEEAFQTLHLDPKLYTNRHWREIDPIYTICRRQLRSQPSWRYGSARVSEVAQEGFSAITPFTNIQNKTYCDLGCGIFHPYGTSAIMYLNGATSCIALDLQATIDHQRAAEALADLIAECICYPEKWNWANIPVQDFIARARHFNMEALRAGQLETGVKGLPLQYIITDIHDPVLKKDAIDVMTSRAVLEHFLDFKIATQRLFGLMRSGGVAYHHIDLVDHRAYDSPNYHYWSFLAEENNWSDGLVNRLRSAEIRQHFEDAGFKILSFKTRTDQMPDNFREQIIGRFKDMPDNELNITGVFCVLKKP